MTPFSVLGKTWLEPGQDILTLDRDRIDKDRHADEVLRHSVASARRLGVVSVASGVGCSHVASRLAVLLAHRRGTSVLGVDAGVDRVFTSLTRAARITPQPADRSVAFAARSLHAPVNVNTLDEAAAGIQVGAAGLRVLRPVSLGTFAVTPADWYRAVSPVARYFDVVLTDWGYRRPGVDFEDTLAQDAVVLVCRADRYSLEVAISVAAAVEARVGCAVCAVDVDGYGRNPAMIAAGWTDLPVFYMPFLPAPAVPVAPTRARHCVIDLGACLMGIATGSAPA